MSLYNSLQTSVNGMNIQARRMDAVSGNIANSSTTGYKRVSAEFETIVLDQSVRNYTSGGAVAQMRTFTTEQGDLRLSANLTDLAIKGNGFFVVQDGDGVVKLTRAGAFVPDADGFLKNTAGLYLMGQPVNGSLPANVTPTIGDLQKISLSAIAMSAVPTTTGQLGANLPSAAAIVTTDLPSANLATSTFTAKTSQVAYDNLGAQKTIDIYYTKTADNTWEITAYDASGSTNGGFPYSSGPLATDTLNFDPNNGKLLTPQSLTVAVPGGQSMTINIGSTTQLATAFGVNYSTSNGSAPGGVDHLEVSPDGMVSYVNTSGTLIDIFKIPLGNVVSPNNLFPVSGNAYVQSSESGPLTLYSAGQGGLGEIMSSTLEASTVDLASELTAMIDAQRSYSANSKSFKTSAEMLEVLMSLKS